MTQESYADPARLAQQVLAAANSLTDEEAGRRYRQILAQLPPDEASQLNTLALAQVAPDQRRVLASGFKQAHQDPGRAFDGYDDDDDEVAASPQSLGRMSTKAAGQDPELLNNLMGGEHSSLGGQVGKAALAALAALLIRKLMSGEGQQAPAGMGGLGGAGAGAPAGMDPVSMILGSLLGGATGAGGQPRAGGAGDLGSILGGLLGGGGQPRAGGAGDLGSILGGLLGGGGQPQAGGADLGSILGSILGGSGPSYRK